MKTLFLCLFAAAIASAQTSPFPISLDTNGNLKVAADNCSTSLTYPMATTDTVAQVANATCIPANSIITFDSEQMGVCSVSGNTLTFGTATVCPSLAGRGLSSTTIATHANGDAGYLLINAYHHAAVTAALKALESLLYPGQLFTGSVTFPGAPIAVRPEWWGGAVTAQAGSVDTFTTAANFAQNSLPLLGVNGQGLRTVKGEIDLLNTGAGTNAYNESQTFHLSSQTFLACGGGGSKIGIAASPSFTGAYLMDVIDAAGTSGDPNGNFNTRIEDCQFDAVTNNGAQTQIGGLSWGVATGSSLRHDVAYTYGIAFLMGGAIPSHANIDNASCEDLTATLYPSGGVLNAQGFVWPQGATYAINTNPCRNIKVISSGTPNTFGCKQPAIDFGAASTGIQIDGLNAENLPCVAVIGGYSDGQQIKGAIAGPDCNPCAPTNYPWAFLVDATARNVRLEGSCYGYRVCVAIGSWWRSQVYSNAYTVIDNQGYIQKVTGGGGGSGGVSQPSWNETPGGTTTDGALTWTNQGLVSSTLPCDATEGIINNCAFPTIAPASGLMNGPVGAANSSDVSLHPFLFDSAQFLDPPPPTVVAHLAADFNSVADQPIYLHIPPACTNVVIRDVMVSNASIPLTTAAGGIYLVASKGGGTPLVAAAQTYTGVGVIGYSYYDLTLGAAFSPGYAGGSNMLSLANSPLYLSLTTPQGSPATANVTIRGDYTGCAK